MYFCKNCGEPYMTDEAVMCVKCGVAKGQGNNYCHNCGKPLAPDAAVCLNCGVANKQAPAPDAKSKLVAGLLAIPVRQLPNWYFPSWESFYAVW